MADEPSPYREKIVQWFIARYQWPPLDQLSEEQKAAVKIFADRYEQIAKEQGVPLEYFTWEVFFDTRTAQAVIISTKAPTQARTGQSQ